MHGSIIVFLIAVLAWFLFTYVLKQWLGFSYTHTPLRTFLFFSVFVGILVSLFPQQAIVLYSNPPLPALFTVFSVLCVGNPLIYAAAKHVPKTRLRDLELLSLDKRFLLSKPADVVFQQTAFGIFILLLASEGVSFATLALIFTCFFMLGHLGMFFRVSFHWALYFFISALLFSVPLVWLLLFVPGGIYYTTSIHMLWYTLGGTLYALARRSR